MDEREDGFPSSRELVRAAREELARHSPTTSTAASDTGSSMGQTARTDCADAVIDAGLPTRGEEAGPSWRERHPETTGRGIPEWPSEAEPRRLWRPWAGVLFVIAAVGVLVGLNAGVFSPTTSPTSTPGTEPVLVDGSTSETRTIVTDTVLTADHDGEIVIGADGVTLDCAGHAITGPGFWSPSPGVLVDRRVNITVKGCTVSGFNDGFRVQHSDNNTFSANKVSNVRQGFTLHDSEDNTLTGNSVIGASDWFGYGLFDGSNRNELRENTATAVSGVGFMIHGAHNNVLIDNYSSNNWGNGFGANPPATGNTYTANRAHDNTNHAFGDNTTGRTGDMGTDNIYIDNVCTGTSHPNGIC